MLVPNVEGGFEEGMPPVDARVKDADIGNTGAVW